MAHPREAIEGIHDLVALRLSSEPVGEGIERTAVLRIGDHLLRRFGQADVVRLQAGATVVLPPRAIADEVWVLVDGRVGFEWQDLRESSPTAGATVNLESRRPIALLVPFGVSFRARAESASVLLRLVTHADEEAPSDALLGSALPG